MKSITKELGFGGWIELQETFTEANEWVRKNNGYLKNEKMPEYLQDEVMRLTECWFLKKMEIIE